MYSASFFTVIKMYSERDVYSKKEIKEIQWKLTEKTLFKETCASYESSAKRDY